MRFLTTLLLVLVCSGALHAAASAEKQLKTYVTLARKTSSQQPLAPAQPVDTNRRLPLASLPALIDHLERLPAPLALESVQGAVIQINAQLGSPDKLRRAGDSLIATLTNERDTRLALFRAEVDALLEKSAQACLEATSPADLDATLKTLAPYQRPDSNIRLSGAMDYAAQQRAAQMFQFVTRWQDYLGARRANETDRVRQTLYELRNLVDPSLVPRSKLFDLETRPAATPAVISPSVPESTLPGLLGRLETVASLDELAPLAGEFARIAAAIPNDPQLADLTRGVHAYLSARTSLEKETIDITLFAANGQPPAVTSNRYVTPRMAIAFQKISLQLRGETLRTVFKDSGLVPAAGEPVDTYVLRVTQAAVIAENWEYALRTLEFYRALFRGNTAPAWTSRELLSCTTYVAARRLDEAGQLPQAILAYQEALRAAGKLTPTQLIATRLAAIKSTQPEAFTTAEQLPRVVYAPSGPAGDPFYNRQQPPYQQPSTYLVPRTERPFKQ